MPLSPKISGVFARQIFDSRGKPTVEVKVTLSDGVCGVAAAPSGASVGKHEALELRDGESSKYMGCGVSTPIRSVNSRISSVLLGMEPFDQKAIDDVLISLDGTKNKSNLGANATVSVSLAVAKAAAASLGMPLYRYLGGAIARDMPLPLVNVINGGLHADNALDFQEFMIAPIGAATFANAARMCSEVFHALKKVLEKKGYGTNVGDEGGFAPNLRENAEVFDILLEAITIAGYRPADDIAIAIDVAASTFYDPSKYMYKLSDKLLSRDDMISYYEEIITQYPIISIEDPMSEDDVDGWKALTKSLKDKVQVVGDDLFVTNPESIENGVRNGLANAVLIKPNQIGTLTETIDAIRVAQRANYGVIVSHRSGETEDTTISHIAVATNCGQIKSGSFSRSERLAKYNELLRIEEDLGKSALFHCASLKV